MKAAHHLWLALLLAGMIVIPRAAMIQRAHSETSDDEYHLVRGLEFLHRDAGLVHRELNDPPLGEALGALPLWMLGGTTHGQVEGSALYGQSGYSPETGLMLVAIWKAILFLPLLAVVFLWCFRLYGPASAWLAVGLLLVEPTITGHLHLAALDVLATTAIVIACFLGWNYFEKGGRGRLIAASAACAAALLIKHTSVLVPGILVLYATVRFRRTGTAGRPARMSAALPAAAALTLIAMWALLGFDLSPVGGARAVPGGLYVQSLRDALEHVSKPNDAYLLGRMRRGGWWYYFPVVATYKVPIGIALVVVLGWLSYFKRRFERREWSLILPLGGYLVFMMPQSINIGWRHFLPAYVFLLMLGSRAAVCGVMGRIVPWIAVSAVALGTTLRWHPDYIPYVTWPRNDAYRAISDSNLDWGQGLKEVRRWIDANTAWINGRTVYLRPFGASSRAIRYYLGNRVIPLNHGDVPPRHGILILSPVCLSGSSESDDEYAFLRGVKPRETIGHALRVYDMDRIER